MLEPLASGLASHSSKDAYISNLRSSKVISGLWDVVWSEARGMRAGLAQIQICIFVPKNDAVRVFCILRSLSKPALCIKSAT
jgi:hypothetical protein